MGAATNVIVDKVVADEPVFHSGGTRVWNATDGTMRLIAQHVRAGDRTLETGAGASTVIFAAAGADHLAISPFGDEHRRIEEYARGLSIDTGSLRFAEGSSLDVLPALPEEEKFDVAFIDGMHSFPAPVVDFHYVDRVLRVGGLLLLDDVPIPAVGVVHAFLAASPDWQFLEFADDRAGAYRKLAEADREDNWRRQPFNKRYPDFSHLPLSRVGQRVKLETTERLPAVKRELGRRFPALKRAWLSRR